MTVSMLDLMKIGRGKGCWESNQKGDNYSSYDQR